MEINKTSKSNTGFPDIKEFLEHVFDNSLVAIIIADNDTIIKRVNPEFTKIFGYSADEARGKRIAELIIPETERDQVLKVKSRIEKGERVGYESIRCTKDGRIIPVHVRVSPIIVDGVMVGGFSFYSDISERKKAQAELLKAREELESKVIQRTRELSESEERYRTLFENSTDFIFTVDLDGNFKDVNKAAEDITGYTKNELIGMNYKDYTPETSHKRIFNAFNKVYTDGKPLEDFPLEVKIKSGEKKDIETCVSPLKKGDDIIGFHGSSRDVTARNRLQAQLSNAIEIANLGPWEYDIQKDLFIVNDYFYKVYRTTVEEVGSYTMSLDEYLQRFVYPDDIPILMEESQKEYDTTDSHYYGQMEHRIIYGDGKFGNIVARIFIVKDAHGNTIKAYGVNQDITERKLIEHQLQQAQKLESIGNLAGGIAHDFNNMLSVILGYGEDILGGLNQTDPLYESVKEIVDAGKLSAMLTRQLLAFSRRQTLRPEILNLNQVIQRIEKMLRRIIGEDIDLKTFLTDELSHVKVDPGQIEQVIMNIATNARDAMPQGGKLTVETANIELDEEYANTHKGVIPGEYVMLSITDNGLGMDEETKNRIFEPFYTTKEKGKGTGLGLSTVYGIIKQSNGNIWVYSEPDHGTTFKIYLPKTVGPLSEKKTQMGDNSIIGKGETIVLIEDEPSLQKFYGRILKILKYNPIVFENPYEALMMVKEKNLRPALMITDIVMPKMSGKALFDRMKEILPDLKVLYMSGYTDNAIVHHGVLDPETPFIQKPFTKATLGKMIRSLLD